MWLAGGDGGKTRVVSPGLDVVGRNYFFREPIAQGMDGSRRAASRLRLGTIVAVCAFAACTSYHAIAPDGASDARPSDLSSNGAGGSPTGIGGSALGTGGASAGTGGAQGGMVGTGGGGMGGTTAGGNIVGAGGQVGTISDAGNDTPAGDGRDVSDAVACDAIGCQGTCSTTAGCAAGTYCSGSSCVPKKAVGAACGGGEECTSAICGGRCCTSACTCPQPWPENIFGSSAGFDSTDLSNWGRTAYFQWNSQDADGCPYSGSIQILSASGDPQRCVAITPGASYTIGGSFKNADGNFWTCYFSLYVGVNCPPAEAPPIAGSFRGTNTAWAVQSTFFQAPADSASLLFYCDSTANSFVDKLFLSPLGHGF
jgi:hypothetical protein